MRTGILVVVGDVHQSIYNWRGADYNALGQYFSLMVAALRFPLTLCRRCPKRVIRDAQCLVPDIQPLPDAPEGEREHISEAQLFETLRRERKGLVLCRANAPLISLCLKLLSARIPAYLARSSIDLAGLIDTLAEYDNHTSILTVLSNLNNWLLEKLAKAAKSRNSEAAAQIANDKAACIIALADEPGIATAGDLKNKIEELFPKRDVNPENTIVLSTIHGMKGGEADNVYLLSPEKEKDSIFNQIWSDARDRDNTLYVAITRSKFRLFYAGHMPLLARLSPLELEEENALQAA